MKLSYDVIIRSIAADSPGHAIEIPALKMKRTFSVFDVQMLRDKGRQYYAKEKVLAVLTQQEDKGKLIKSQGILDSYLDAIIDRKSLAKLDIHDYNLKVEVDFKPRGSGCCAKIFPWVMRISVVVEIACGTILSIGAIELTQTFIDAKTRTGLGISIAQAVICAFFELFMVYMGPGMTFMSDLGATVDSFFYNRCCKIATPEDALLKHSLAKQKDNMEMKCSKTRVLSVTARTLFFIGVLIHLLTDAEKDYQELKQFSDILSQDGLLPHWLLVAATWISFGFNQINDPVLALSFCAFGFRIIASYFDPSQNELAECEEEPSSPMVDGKIDNWSGLPTEDYLKTAPAVRVIATGALN